MINLLIMKNVYYFSLLKIKWTWGKDGNCQNHKSVCKCVCVSKVQKVVCLWCLFKFLCVLKIIILRHCDRKTCLVFQQLLFAIFKGLIFKVFVRTLSWQWLKWIRTKRTNIGLVIMKSQKNLHNIGLLNRQKVIKKLNPG